MRWSCEWALFKTILLSFSFYSKDLVDVILDIMSLALGLDKVICKLLKFGTVALQWRHLLHPKATELFVKSVDLLDILGHFHDV